MENDPERQSSDKLDVCLEGLALLEWTYLTRRVSEAGTHSLLPAFCMEAPTSLLFCQLSVLSVYNLNSGHFCPCSLDMRRSGAIDFITLRNSAPAELEALWQSLSRVYKMVMRTLPPADNEAHTRSLQQISMGCLFCCLENAAQRKRQSSWQAGTSTLATRKKKERKLTFPGPWTVRSVEFAFCIIIVNY